MLSRPLATWLAARGIHYAWVVVAVAFLTMLTTAGAMGLPGALIRPLGAEFGWSTGDVSAALSLRIALFGLMGPFAAALIGRHGVRAVVLTAITLIAAGLLGALVMSRLWHLLALWGVVVGLGSGMTAFVLGAIIANRWFSTRRGLVLGLLTASSATGQLAFLPLATWLVELGGWRAAVLPTLAALTVAWVLALLLLRDRPADLGLLPYGEALGTRIETAPPPVPAFAAAFGALAEAARTRTFWILAGTFFICGLSTNGLIQTHFIPLCGDYGLDPTAAASVLAMMGICDFVGTIASGWLSDRYDNRRLLFWYYGLRGLSLLWLPQSVFTLAGLAPFALFYGLDWIATVPPTVKLAGAAYGRERAGVVFGWVFAAHMVGAAAAAYGAGLTRDAVGSYLPAFYVAGAMCLVAAGAVLLIRRPGAPDSVAAPVAPVGARPAAA